MTDRKIIMDTSDEAAQIKTVTGWVSRHGHFFGEDERLARYDGSTHRLCDCGALIERHSYCRACERKRQIEKYKKMERKEWNGTDALYSDAFNGYVWDEEGIQFMCEENECTIEDLHLIICVPQYAHEIDPGEYYSDLLPDDNDGEVDQTLADAFEELNKVIREHRVPMSWTPGKYAAVIPSSAATSDEQAE